MRTKKIDDEVLLRMFIEEGKTQKEIAAFFGCTPPPICRRLKKLLPKRIPENFEELTEKEKNFCVAMAEGKNQTEAALVAYDTESRGSARVIGSQLMAKPDIQQAIADLMDINGLTKDYRVKKLKKHVDDKDGNISLRALDMSFKLDNSYPPQRNLNLNLNAAVDPVDFNILLKTYRPGAKVEAREMRVVAMQKDNGQPDTDFSGLEQKYRRSR
jgi:DNA-binding Lrp family transcriptional regulator